jgi:hypothetical protein
LVCIFGFIARVRSLSIVELSLLCSTTHITVAPVVEGAPIGKPQRQSRKERRAATDGVDVSAAASQPIVIPKTFSYNPSVSKEIEAYACFVCFI